MKYSTPVFSQTVQISGSVNITCNCLYNHQHCSNHPLSYWQNQMYTNAIHFLNTTHRCASNFLPLQRLSILTGSFWPVKRRHICKRVMSRNPSRLMNHFPHCPPSLLEIYTIITTAIISFLTFGVTVLMELTEAICLTEGLLLIKRSGSDSYAVCVLSVLNMGKSIYNTNGTSRHQ